MTSDGKIYVLMVTVQKTVQPILAPATPQGAIEASCSFEVFPAAVSDDAEALRERARKMREEFPTIEGWNTVEVPVIGSIDREALLALAEEAEKNAWYFALDHDEDELRDRLAEAAEDFSDMARRIREALGVSE